MNFSLILIALVVAIFLFKSKQKKAKKVGPKPPSGWCIGPFINGENYSVNMPLEPTMQGAGWYIDFPSAPGHVNYVQWQKVPSLAGKREIRFRFKMEGHATSIEFPQSPASVSLYLQRKGDNWRSSGYRFHAGTTILTEGEHDVLVPLNAWADVLSESGPEAFAAALQDCDNLAVVFGSAGGLGHGVYGSGRFTLISLTIR